ncbi:glutamate racemase [Leptospira perolatii]|uniref:Glutamate racemase n=1 Tax=Leptospira perolatii TaxID=2023191 RepID=A0A2M9ZN26_9LEPT|nr:glutamate racemase [Leptospira perolatii]PJZ68925.1 glutamate racemase [Leptospira perolatii]PJZ73457.1 glutamate racemase [Leptospira perolatii]
MQREPDRGIIKIGVMDSGMGGLSVLKELLNSPFRAEYLYFGDLLNAPYGERETSEVADLTRKACEFLIQKGAQAILLACNTATSAAASLLRSDLPIPIFGMEPAIKPALANHPGERIALLATSVTHREEKLKTLKASLGADERIVHVSCDGLASLVDRGDMKGAGDYLKRILAQLEEEKIRGIVLGCTHYVFLKDVIMSLSPDSKLYDGNIGTVTHLVRSLGLDSNLGEPIYELHFSKNLLEIDPFEQARKLLGFFSEP